MRNLWACAAPAPGPAVPGVQGMAPYYPLNFIETGAALFLSNAAGLSSRLRYEIRRKFTPYAGVNWRRQRGQAADFSWRADEDAGASSFASGIRFWF